MLREMNTAIATISIDEDDVVSVKLVMGAYETYETLEENAIAIYNIAGGKGDNLVIMDVRNARGVSKEARQLAKSKKYMYVYKAVAIVVGNPLTRMLSSFFIGFSEPGFPVKIFDSEVDARTWLITNHK